MAASMKDAEAAETAARAADTERAKTPAKATAGRSRLLPFAVISITYLLFTVTDGALRMIVLLHAYNQSFSAMQVATMFTLYESAGVVTNLAAGFAGARWGIRVTLVTGLCLQLLTYGMLFGWREEWGQGEAIVYVTVSQMFGGIAKDLTKLGGKTVTKLVTPEEKTSQLFKLVSLLTGWKNSLKGVGYFLGSALLLWSYEAALAAMMALVAVALPFAVFGLDASLGTTKKSNATCRQAFVTGNANLNWLSLARCFLFASRDFWFEVPLPFFLRSPSCLDEHASGDLAGDGERCGGLGWSRVAVGAILGAYIIVYGQCQSWTPQLVLQPLGQGPPNKQTEILWGVINCMPTAVMAAVCYGYGASATDGEPAPAVAYWLMTAVVCFALIFAVNSAVHSFLVVHYAKADKVAQSVGFYYMSNACGRLLGTIGSGALYTSGADPLRGLGACFIAGTISSALAALITLRIKDDAAGLRCGSCICVAAQGGPSLEKSTSGEE